MRSLKLNTQYVKYGFLLTFLTTYTNVESSKGESLKWKLFQRVVEAYLPFRVQAPHRKVTAQV
jgi:hypothetical protein